MDKKILIVDDEEAIVTLLRFNIEKAGFETDIAFDGKKAIKKAEKNNYALIVLDLMLPGLNGLEVCKYLRSHHNETPILMLTARGAEEDKIKGLELGADDYLTKPFSPKEVVARINAILRRTTALQNQKSTTLKIGDITIYPERYEAVKNGESISFTRKEFELLYYLAKHAGRVLSRDQLLLAVWNYDFVGDTRIVDVHVSRLREKIEVDTKNPRYIKTIRGLGYKMEVAFR